MPSTADFEELAGENLLICQGHFYIVLVIFSAPLKKENGEFKLHFWNIILLKSSEFCSKLFQ